MITQADVNRLQEMLNTARAGGSGQFAHVLHVAFGADTNGTGTYRNYINTAMNESFTTERCA